MAIVPIIDFFFRLIFGIAITLLKTAFELILLARDDIEIIVGQLAPLLLDLAFHLLPISFDAVPIHGCYSPH